MRLQYQYTESQRQEQKIDYSGGAVLDVNDLANEIVAQAVSDWVKPSRDAYLTICFGDPHMGIEACPYRGYYKCFNLNNHNPRRGGHYYSCLERRSRLKQELIKFFNSAWFETICNTDPAWLRAKIGVPTVERLVDTA